MWLWFRAVYPRLGHTLLLSPRPTVRGACGPEDGQGLLRVAVSGQGITVRRPRPAEVSLGFDEIPKCHRPGDR